MNFLENESYNETKVEKMLDKTISYFQAELDILNSEYYDAKSDKNFITNLVVLIFSAFIVLLAAFIQQFLSFEWLILNPNASGIIQFLLVVTFLTLIFLLGEHVYQDQKRYRRYISRKIRLEFIIKYILFLKLMSWEKYVNKLINRIKFDFRDFRPIKSKSVKDYENWEVERLNEYVNIIDEINHEIIKHEN